MSSNLAAPTIPRFYATLPYSFHFAFPLNSQKQASGQVAQSVEQRTENPCVGGSIPSLATSTVHSETTVLKKIPAAAFALCAAFAPAPSAFALSPADREERIFVFNHALVASMRAARGEHLAAAEMFDEIARHTSDPQLARAAATAAETSGHLHLAKNRAAEAAQSFALAAKYARTWRDLGGGNQAEIRAVAAIVRTGNLPAAETELHRLVQQGAISPTILHSVLAGAENHAGAVEAGKRLFRGDSDSQYHFGRLASRFEQPKIARQAFARAAQAAEKPEPHLALAYLDEGDGGIKAAMPQLDDYRKKECPGASAERCHESYVLLAYRQFSRGENWRETLDNQHRPSDLQARAHLEAGEMLEAAELPKRAAQQYGQVPSGEFYFQARLGMARIARDNGDNTLALNILDETPTGGQRDFAAREITAAHVLNRRDGPAAALRRIAEARKVAPTHSGMLYTHSLYAEQSGDVPLAVRLLETMTTLFPDDADGWNALGYVMADHGINLPEARTHITRALRIKPNDPNILDSLGWVHYRLGNLNLALRHLEEAAKQSDSAEIAAHLGEVLWELGRRDTARQIWRRALERDEANPVLDKTLTRYQPF